MTFGFPNSKQNSFRGNYIYEEIRYLLSFANFDKSDYCLLSQSDSGLTSESSKSVNFIEKSDLGHMELD